MGVTVEMPEEELAALKKLTHLDNDADAIMRAARELLRLSALRELKSASGTVDFDPDWQSLEALELGASAVPQ